MSGAGERLPEILLHRDEIRDLSEAGVRVLDVVVIPECIAVLHNCWIVDLNA